VCVITLPEPAHLAEPAVDVRISYLTGAQADRRARHEDADRLGHRRTGQPVVAARRAGQRRRP
jgi:hypothetical protein